jgi:glucose/arabinose dehydrogenase
VAADDKLRTGRAAFGDWTEDAPGARRKITVADLPPPNQTSSADNGPDVVSRPKGAEPQVLPGFVVEQYAGGFTDPRFLLTAPNGDVFVVESSANEIKVLRDGDGDGKPEMTQLFTREHLNQAFGIAFYPPGRDPHYLYVANTNGVIRFPYRNGDMKARGRAELLGAQLSPGGLLRGGGHWTRGLAFSADGKKCTSRSGRSRITPIGLRKQTALASSNLIPTALDGVCLPGAFAMLSGSWCDPARTNSG